MLGQPQGLQKPDEWSMVMSSSIALLVNTMVLLALHAIQLTRTRLGWVQVPDRRGKRFDGLASGIAGSALRGSHLLDSFP